MKALLLALLLLFAAPLAAEPTLPPAALADTPLPDAAQEAKAQALMHELRAIGANYARSERPRGLHGRERLRRVTAAYETLRHGGVLPSSWEVITTMAWSPGPGAARREGGFDIAAFPADRIPRRRR